jgi:hypothetical protein
MYSECYTNYLVNIIKWPVILTKCISYFQVSWINIDESNKRGRSISRHVPKKIAVETTRKQSNITDAGVALHVDRFVSLQDSS